ncbi:MAG: TetR/AcrR family transcriptional regulator [bacterium]
MARRNRVAEERQGRIARILEAGEKLFIRKGFNQTSILDIAEQADFSRTSIYQYFPGKEEIYASILEKYTDELTDRIAGATAAAPSTEEKIRAFLDEMRRMKREKPDFFRLYFIQRHLVEPKLRPAQRAQLNAKRRKLENVFRDFYREGAARGEVRPIRIKDASNLFFAQIMGMLLLHEYYGDEFDVSLDEHLDQSLAMYLEYVGKGNSKSRASAGSNRKVSRE